MDPNAPTDAAPPARPLPEGGRRAAALEAAGVGLWERDAAGRLVHWSEAMYRLRGFDPRDPRPCAELDAACTEADEAQRLHALQAAHLQQGVPYRMEFRIRHADGSLRWLATQGQAVRDAQGGLVGLLGVDLDITERKRSEALQREKERVAQASRDKSAFMARISHELRTPLNAVLGFARLMDDDRDEPPTPRQRERLRRIAQGGERLLALVDDLLGLAQLEPLEAEASTLALAPAPAWAVLQEAARSQEALARELGVQVELEPLQSSVTIAVEPQVLADRARLVRSLGLVIEQGLARSRRGGRLGLRLQAEPAAGGASATRPPRLAFVVSDDGERLTEEQRLWLFETFAPPETDGGAGQSNPLRLALARRAVEAMGGELQAAPEAGGGLQMRLVLPQVPPEDRPSDRSPPANGPAVEAAGGEARLELLCVEDNPVNLQLVRELVGLRPQVCLRTATDAAEGLAAARQRAPHVMLLDMQLPDLHGIELMRRLRAQPATARCTYIALSADAMPEHIDAALAAGFDAYWTKPIDFAGFLGGLDRLVAAWQQGRASPAPAPAAPAHRLTAPDALESR